MVRVAVLPEVLAAGPSFRVGEGLTVHLIEDPDDAGKVDLQLETDPDGEYWFISRWAASDPAALAVWSEKLVQSLNRMVAEGLESVNVPMPVQV